MARIRTVKPELWTDPDFIDCSLSARLLFIASWNFATDFGVLPDKARQLKMQCLPADPGDAEQLIEELVSHDFLVRRIAPNGDKVLVIRTFSKNQKINRRSLGRWGDPAKWDTEPEGLSEDSVRTHGVPPPGRDTDNSDNSDGSDTSDKATRSTGGDLTPAEKKKCTDVLETIIARRIDGKPVGASYRQTVHRDVKDNYAAKIARLVPMFPDAPVDMLAHGAETGDTRNLAHYAAGPTADEPDEPKLTPDQIAALTNRNTKGNQP